MQSPRRPVARKSILILMKGALERAVPIISVARSLCGSGHRVEVACGTCADSLRRILESENIAVRAMGAEAAKEKDPNILGKLSAWLSFRRHAKAMLRHRHYDLVYIGSADTAIALSGAMAKYPYLLHLRELHDQEPSYMRALEPMARDARRVVVPEENRAYLYQGFFDLARKPAVLPNKPWSHPRQRQLDIGFLPLDVQAQMRARKLLIYQGHIHKERDLHPIARSLVKVQDYTLLVMGKDHGPLASYREILPDILHIPFVEPPRHLNVTSWAHIGLIVYDKLSLNTIYCAPNKTWEYSGFAIPMLCSDNPGLQYTVGAAGAAKLVDVQDQASVLRGLRALEAEYDDLSRNASALFDATNFQTILESLIEEIV